MTTFFVYGFDRLEFLGVLEAADDAAARELAAAVWTVPLKVLTWRLRPGDRPAA
jgi:hypothetical protein